MNRQNTPMSQDTVRQDEFPGKLEGHRLMMTSVRTGNIVKLYRLRDHSRGKTLVLCQGMTSKPALNAVEECHK